ncbi:MAG: hypothetical protein M1820_002361 [Bogoriella megaspora]|nr:MAG: hypothetical protein M1820_002361 [Bogoriella megaspora]
MKTFASLVIAFTFAGIGGAHPFSGLFKRQTLLDLNDVDIINYALTLEHLEAAFYRQAVANFTASDFVGAGYNETAYHNVQQIAADEAEHVDFLTSVLTCPINTFYCGSTCAYLRPALKLRTHSAKSVGQPAPAECSYDFGVASVPAFIATAALLEGVGVSAYLGAAAQIANKAYLTPAGSILAVEARHSSYLRSLLDEVPFAQPFDTPLTPDEVFTLGHGFITSCPSSNPPLKVKAFPGLTIDPSSPGPSATGSQITIDTAGYALEPRSPGAHLYAAFISVNGPVWTDVTELPDSDGTKFNVTIPQGVSGQSYLVLTGCHDAVTDDTVVAGPVIIEVLG